MKANLNSGKEYASETSAHTWNSINWNSIEQKVSALQARIVKAYREKKYRKVKSLQWVLTRSYAGKLLAVKRATFNKGGRISGVDVAVWLLETVR